MNVPTLIALLDDYASRVGLDARDLLGLFNEDDDWTFVVKSTALLEAALNQSLLAVLKPVELWQALERSGLDKKARWAADCGRITVLSREAIRSVAPIRNAVVHDIRAFNFSFERYFANPDNADIKVRFQKCVSAAIEEGQSGVVLDVCAFPPLAMWRLVLLVLQQVEKPSRTEQTSLDKLVRQLVIRRLEGPTGPATSPDPASNE